MHSGIYLLGYWLFYFISIPCFCFSQKPQVYEDSLRILINSLPVDTSLVNSYNRLASLYAKAHSDSAELIAQKAIAVSKKLNYNIGVADALMILSKYQRSKGNYVVALENALKSLHEYESLKAIAQAATTEVEIAQIYKDMGGQNRTEEYINTGINYGKSAYALYESIGDTAGMVMSLNMQGILYRDKGKILKFRNYYDTALSRYNSAFTLLNKSGKGVEYTGKLYNNISQVYLEHKQDYTKALEYLFKAVEFNKSRNVISSLSFNYGNIANAYSKLNDYNSSLKYARLMLEVTIREGLPGRIQNAYQQLYVSFKSGGQLDSALRYYILADRLNDSLTNLAKSQQVMDLQIKYETAKKETEIEKLNEKGATQNRRIAVLIFVLILIAASAATTLWLYQRVKKQKQQIALQSHRLEVMMKELHHRVKNNLQIVSSLLSLQTYKLHDEETISVFKESQQRVQAMSLIHQRLYTKDLLTAVNMKEYITDLVESLLSSYGFGRDDFDLNIKVEKELLDVEKALPIGLLINEIATNALKYAYKNITTPALTIELSENMEDLILIVKDNGPGINLIEWKKKGSSFGKQLINVLGKQLRARQTVAVENGTQFTISIPNKAA